MGSEPSNNVLMQQLQLLLTGYGYNFYNKTNQARADDLLVLSITPIYVIQ